MTRTEGVRQAMRDLLLRFVQLHGVPNNFSDEELADEARGHVGHFRRAGKAIEHLRVSEEVYASYDDGRWEVFRLDRMTHLRCQAVNIFSLAACYREEAENLQREANALRAAAEEEAFALDPEVEFDPPWESSDIDIQRTSDLPEEWMSLAELPDLKWPL